MRKVLSSLSDATCSVAHGVETLGTTLDSTALLLHNVVLQGVVESEGQLELKKLNVAVTIAEKKAELRLRYEAAGIPWPEG